ncbi:MAG: hypothetical protein WBF55_08770 [Syntrophobacteria bacterium]
MAVLPGVLGCRPLRRTVEVRLGTNTLRLPSGTPIFFALAALRSVPQAGSQFRGLATAIHEISGLTFRRRILFGSFFRLAKLLGDYLVVRIKFAGILEGVNCLWPLVADSIKTA